MPARCVIRHGNDNLPAHSHASSSRSHEAPGTTCFRSDSIMASTGPPLLNATIKLHDGKHAGRIYQVIRVRGNQHLLRSKVCSLLVSIVSMIHTRCVHIFSSLTLLTVRCAVWQHCANQTSPWTIRNCCAMEVLWHTGVSSSGLALRPA